MQFNTGLNSLKKLLIDFKSSSDRISKLKREYNYDDLKKVRISCRNTDFDNFIKLQTPHQDGIWGNTAFISRLNPDIDLVVNKPNPYLPLSRNIEKNWLLHIEPPGYIKKLDMANEKVVEKFSRVYTCDPDLYSKGGKFIASPPYVHWHLALSSYTSNKDNMVYDYDFLNSLVHPPEKTISLASINSGMNDLPGHKLRADFVSKICDENIDFNLYGTPNWAKYKQYKGPTTFGKWPIYSKAKYVLAIENEVSDYYWTEKFTDAILCFTIPIYYGSAKISDFFPEGSYIPFDITKKTAVDELQDILKSDFYEKNLHNLIAARNLILTKHNMFSFLNSQVNNII